MRKLVVLLLLLVMIVPVSAQDNGLTLTALGTHVGEGGEGASEIVAYDAGTQRMFITNGAADAIDVVDISDPANPTIVEQIDISEFGDGVNSVAVANGLVAAAVEGAETGDAGTIVVMNAETLEVVNTYEAGALPDMVTFSPDGSVIAAANEGEPNDDYSIDPEGSVTLINLEDDSVTQVTFESFNDMIPENVRVFGPDATLAQDLEPEYITFSPDGSTAFVIAQENNTMIVIDVATGEVSAIAGLGYKDYSLEENAIDPSNEDGEINMRPVPVFGMYQPDAIAAYEVNGEVYVVTANEGDARDYETFSEEARIADLTLDPDAFPNAEELQAESNLGRLLVTTTLGDTDGDGDYDELYNYGARSFTIWNTSLEVVFDSGSAFETITADLIPEVFNSNGLPDSFDQRSDDKGPEPEALAIGTVGEHTYAFIGLERVGGIMVYNVTDPANASFVTYFSTTNIDGSLEDGTAGDVSPEGLLFVPAVDSPTGNPLLLIAYEISGTTSIVELTHGM